MYIVHVRVSFRFQYIMMMSNNRIEIKQHTTYVDNVENSLPGIVVYYLRGRYGLKGSNW